MLASFGMTVRGQATTKTATATRRRRRRRRIATALDAHEASCKPWIASPK
jgi:hypothetical protein